MTERAVVMRVRTEDGLIVNVYEHSPLAEALKGKRVGDSFYTLDHSYTIIPNPETQEGS